ncbi:MAG: DNA repair protein RecO [Saprospiraceae bacterium]|nr:DNA repair protein RecO [Saprospiraceae bacterium]MBP7679739.1 DNA repair protein RecO [Saprospiraceae bacterium]
MLLKTRGIIFRTLKYSETSIIADIYTKEKGLRSYIISGVRSKGAKTKIGLLQVASIVDMVVYHQDNTKLHRIKEIAAAHIYTSLPFDVRKSAIALFIIELSQKTIKETEPNAPLFEFLFSCFTFLDKTTQSFTNLHLFYSLGLSAYLGFMPSGEYSTKTPFFNLKEGGFESQNMDNYCLNETLSQYMSKLLQTTLGDIHTINMTTLNRRILLEKIITYYKLHIDYMTDIHAHEVLHEVFG